MRSSISEIQIPVFMLMRLATVLHCNTVTWISGVSSEKVQTLPPCAQSKNHKANVSSFPVTLTTASFIAVLLSLFANPG